MEFQIGTQTDTQTDRHTDIRTCWAASSQLKTFISRQDSDAAPEPCLLCDVLDDSLRGVRGHIDSVRDRENEVGLDLPDFTDNDELEHIYSEQK